MKDDPDKTPPALTRRRFFQGLTLIPVAAALPGCAPGDAPGQAAPRADAGTPYAPQFFTTAEWAFVVAACDRLIPSDEVGPGAVESGVPEFLDRHMQTPYAAGDIWYMQGPFLEAPSEFGYQGKLALRDILRVGIGALDAHCRKQYQGKTFAQLDHAEQENLLTAAEGGKLELEGISGKLFFANLLVEVKNGYFAHP